MMHHIYEITKISFFSFIFFGAILIIQKSRNKNKGWKNNIKNVKDVLFVNGVDSKFHPHSYRYRVLHQMEQLNAGFLESDEFFYINFEPIIVKNYRVIIFYHCPWTENIQQAITLAKSLNKKVLFDIDDLVIDTKYTDKIPFIQTLSKKEKKLYDNRVMLIGKTLKECDAAITTTKNLAKELKNYVSNVFINHNVASEEMWKLSQDALINKDITNKNDYIIIGYFSGSISHNSDIEMIMPALLKIIKEFENVKLLFLGQLNLKSLNEFSSKLIKKPFVDWHELAPIENIIFNAVKSENKWVEASLVKVPTIASNYGIFKNVIKHNETGLLCSDNNDWYISLKSLIVNPKLRKMIGENAFNLCKKEYNTIYTGRKFSYFINSISNKHIAFFLPSIEISGGIYVILKHASILKDEGWDVDLILPSIELDLFEFQDHKFNIISLSNEILATQYDIIVATLYLTVYNILNYFRTKKHLYLVQGYETDFNTFGDGFRSIAEKTYSMPFNIEYATVSKWCENWLWKKYGKKAKYAPNGIDFDDFISYKRNLKKKKIRILIEGDSSSYYKNIDESFKIIEKLNKDKFEIWYLSYNGKPKEWYKYDKFLNKIPHENVMHIYEDCDILLKSSWLESFSYPPLEMMATGGYSIVVPNGGNKEYLKNGENCLLYKLGDLDSAVRNIERLLTDEQLQQKLYENGLITAKNRDWKNYKSQIISLYS